jgi:hypothetical protein
MFDGCAVKSVPQARFAQTQSLNKDVSRDRDSLDSYTAVTGVRSAHGGECFSRSGASNKQVTRSGSNASLIATRYE